MKKSIANMTVNVPVNGSQISFRTGLYNALDCASASASQFATIKNAYIKKHGDKFDGFTFAKEVAAIVAEWRVERRAELVERWGTRGSWERYGELLTGKAHDPVKSGSNAASQWLDREVSYKINFNVKGGRAKPREFENGVKPVQAYEVIAQEAKQPKQVQATGKNDAPANVDNGQSEDKPAEKFNGQKLAASLSETEARSALLNILNQYPELTMDKSVKDNFSRNFEKASKKAASQKKLAKKAA